MVKASTLWLKKQSKQKQLAGINLLHRFFYIFLAYKLAINYYVYLLNFN